ncbi:MAG: tetratricopeptide repeat protein [Bacteroidota bacterium]
MPETKEIPIIFLAYANRERAESIEELVEENKQIRETLQPMEDKRACTILEENPDDNVFFWDLALQPGYRERIQVVHLAGGRPGRKYLRMSSSEGEIALEADEFADFFAQLPNLNLIFITGSANPRLVRRLLIKTRASVIRLENDEQNEGVVSEFYSQLAKGFVVKRAFGQTTINCGDHLMYEILTLGELTAPPFQRRDIFEGLYVRNDHRTSLEWKLSPSFYILLDSQQGQHGDGGERAIREEDSSRLRPWLKPILAGIISLIGVSLLLLSLFSDLPNRWVNQLTGSSVCPFPEEDDSYNVLVLPFYVEESCRRADNSYRSAVRTTLQQFREEGGLPLNVQYHDAQCPTSDFFAKGLGGTCNADLLVWATQSGGKNSPSSFEVNFTSTDTYEEVQFIEERGNPMVISASSAESFTNDIRGRLQEIIFWSQGMQRFSKGNYQDAITFFRLIASQPGGESASCEKLIARSYAQSKNYLQAIEHFNTALQMRPEDAILWIERGKTFIETSDFDAARGDFEKALELSPSSSEAYLAMGSLYQELDLPDSALYAFNQAVSVDPDNIEAYLNRADQHRMMKHIDEAFTDYSHCIRKAPTRPEAFRGVGYLYEDLGKYQDAINYYSRALEVQPRDAEAYFARGVLHARYARLDKALIDLSDAIDINPNKGKYYGYRAIVYKELEEESLALEDAREGVKLSPDLPILYALRGQVYTYTKDFTLAANDFDSAVELNPKCSEAFYGRGLLNYTLGNEDKAISDLEEAIAARPSMAYALCKLGEIYMYRAEKFSESNDTNSPAYKQAIKESLANYNKAIEVDPGLSYAYELRADLHVETGDLEAALEDNSVAISQNNGRAEPYSNRAGIYTELENYEEAEKDVQRAIELSKGGKPMDFYLLARIYAAQKNDSLFYKNLELALKKGIPADVFIDPTYNDFQEEERFQKLLADFSTF